MGLDIRQRDILLLPHVGHQPFDKSVHVCRSVQRRIQRKAHKQSWANDAVDTINNADSLVAQFEQMKKDLDGKVDAKEIETVEKDVTALRTMVEEANKVEAVNADLTKIKAQFEQTQKVMQEMSAKLYEQAAAANNAEAGNEGADAKSDKKDEKVVDAEFEEKAKETKKE